MTHYKAICSILCSLSITVLVSQAQAIQLCGKQAQGEILSGYAPEASNVIFNQKEYALTPDGRFMIAFGRDDIKQQSFTIVDKEGNKHIYNLEIAPTKWNVQKINGIPQKKVTPSKNDQKEIDRERISVRKALSYDIEQPYWQTGFIKPIDGRTSGEFGGQRIMNGQKKNPHQGWDIAAPQGTKIKASAGGVVTLSGGDYFYSGNMVVIDHGQNLTTIYAHMSKVSVKPGDIVKQGDIIGEVGKTGRATGPHLHWGASLNGTRFNPQSLLSMNNADFCFNL